MNKRKSDSTRKLKQDEKVLWNLVTRTITPLKPRVAQSELDEEFASYMREAAVRGKGVMGASAKAGVTKPKAADQTDILKTKRTRSPAPIASHIDRPVYRKIAKGRLPIDSQIDLHDMTQEQAINRLEVFLTRARNAGHRHVLVITGKGGSPTSEGVLRRMLPIWLNLPQFASIVNGYQAASRSHGGDGAFYVRLRRH